MKEDILSRFAGQYCSVDDIAAEYRTRLAKPLYGISMNWLSRVKSHALAAAFIILLPSRRSKRL